MLFKPTWKCENWLWRLFVCSFCSSFVNLYYRRLRENGLISNETEGLGPIGSFLPFSMSEVLVPTFNMVGELDMQYIGLSR